jgi:hypothetical protein
MTQFKGIRPVVMRLAERYENGEANGSGDSGSSKAFQKYGQCKRALDKVKLLIVNDLKYTHFQQKPPVRSLNRKTSREVLL